MGGDAKRKRDERSGSSLHSDPGVGSGKPLLSMQLARRFCALGAVLGGGGVVLAILAGTLPIRVDVDRQSTASGMALESRADSRAEIEPLLARLAGMPLIRPAQVQAAVKNDGSAERLLKKLKLQGVVQVGSELVAYIQVDDGGKVVRSIHSGQTVLDFNVENIEPGKVTLSLQGVVVVLSQG